jgi:hypothetical protein
MTFQCEPPWDRLGTYYYWKGPLSSFSRLPKGLQLPAAWYGHPATPDLVTPRTLEHWFQAAKCTNAEDFAWVLAAPTAMRAKGRGSRDGESGRRITLRPDWEGGTTLRLVGVVVIGYSNLVQ